MNRLQIGVALIATAAASYALVNQFVPKPETAHHEAPLTKPASGENWTCSMHPDVLRHGPGTCPICGMALIKVASGETVPHAEQVHVNAVQQRNIGVALERMEPNSLSGPIRLPGQVVVDERGEVTLSPKVEGWIRKLGVSGVGQPIQRGQVLFEIYSPDLQQRQRDYLDLMTRRDALVNRPEGMAVGNAPPEAMMTSIARERFRARARLAAADVPEDVLAAIDFDRRVRDWVPIRAQRDGILTSLNVRDGGSVSPVQSVLSYSARLAGAVDLTFTPEQLARVKTGALAAVTSSIDPQQSFSGPINLRTAVVDPTTRLARVRLPLPESARRDAFLPGSSVQVSVASGGDAVLSVPSDAVLRNNEGDYVIVADGADHFRPLRVVLGADNGDRVEVKVGLKQGQDIVVNGQFLIGAEASWRAVRARQVASAAPEAEPASHHHGH